ncbi:hypothetical protein ACSZME_02035 [Aeromonas dhakensis]
MSNRTAAARWRWLRQHIKTLRNSELEPEEKGTTWRFAGLVVAAIPALTAATYLLGMAYHYGYTLAFNLDYAEFSPPADYLLALSLLTTLNMLKPWMWPVLGSMLTIFQWRSPYSSALAGEFISHGCGKAQCSIVG